MTGEEKQRPPLELRDGRPGHVEAESMAGPGPAKKTVLSDSKVLIPSCCTPSEAMNISAGQL